MSSLSGNVRPPNSSSTCPLHIPLIELIIGQIPINHCWFNMVWPDIPNPNQSTHPSLEGQDLCEDLILRWFMCYLTNKSGLCGHCMKVWNCQNLKLFNTRDEPTEMYAKTCTTKNLVPWGQNTMVKRFSVFHWKPQSIILSYRTGPQNSYSYNHQVPWSYCKSQVSHMFASTHFHDTRVAPKASQSWPIRTYSLQAALMASRVPPKVRKTLT